MQTTQKNKLTGYLHIIILAVMLIASVVTNYFLVREVNLLRQEIKLKDSQQLLPGTIAPVFSAYNSNGNLETLLFEKDFRPTVLYIFSPECGWCERNFGNIRFLNAATNSKYRFIGVSMHKKGLEEYLKQKHYPFPVYNSPPIPIRIAYSLKSTPKTIVISPDSKILRNWSGAFTEETQREVETFFNVSLPGVTAARVDEH